MLKARNGSIPCTSRTKEPGQRQDLSSLLTSHCSQSWFLFSKRPAWKIMWRETEEDNQYWPVASTHRIVVTPLPNTHISTVETFNFFVNLRSRKLAVRLCPRKMSEAAHMKPYQHGCLHVTYTRMTSVYMFTWKGEVWRGCNPRQRTAGNQGMLRVRERVWEAYCIKWEDHNEDTCFLALLNFNCAILIYSL